MVEAGSEVDYYDVMNLFAVADMNHAAIPAVNDYFEGTAFGGFK